MSELPAAAAGTIAIGGDLTVNRLGYGAMRITGRGHHRATRPTATRPARAAPRRRAGRRLHRHRRQLRTARERGAHRRGAAPLPGRPRDRHQGRAAAARPPAAGPPTDGRRTCAQALEGSLRTLRLERIDLYQLHRPDPEVPYEESVGALAELRREGKIRHIGVSNVTRRRAAPRPAGDRDRRGAEPLQPARPALRRPGRHLRARRARLPALGAGRRRATSATTSSPTSPGGTACRRIRSSSPGCWRARRRCCRSRGPARWRTSRRTWPRRGSRSLPASSPRSPESSEAV